MNDDQSRRRAKASDPHDMTRSSVRKGIRVTLAGLLVSALLASAKIVAGILGNSYALIADGVESVLDMFSSVVVWGGLKIASIPPDDNHPYGHGKAEPLGGLIVAVTLLAAAVGIAIQSGREILSPHHAPKPFTLLVLLVVVVTKEVMFRVLVRTGEAIRSHALKSDAWHHRSDALTSVAAFIGISVALVAGEGYESAGRHSVPDFSLEISTTRLRRAPTPLLEKERDFTGQAAIAYVQNPPKIHRAVRRAAFATHNHPVDAVEV